MRLRAGDHPFMLLTPFGTTRYVDYVRLSNVEHERNAIEAESLAEAATASGGSVTRLDGIDVQTHYSEKVMNGLSGRGMLEWAGAPDGATLLLRLTAPADGDYELELGVAPLTAGPHLDVLLDNAAVSTPLDLSTLPVAAPNGDGFQVQRVRAMRLAGLKAGPHVLTLINRSGKAATLDLDYLRLQRSLYPGAIEAEGLRVVDAHDGDPQTQEMTGFGPGWSGDAQFWFLAQKPGAEATLELPFTAAGRYRLVVYYTTARDYGIAQALVDGKEVGGSTDCYTPNVLAKGRTGTRHRRPDRRSPPHHLPRNRQKPRIVRLPARRRCHRTGVTLTSKRRDRDNKNRWSATLMRCCAFGSIDCSLLAGTLPACGNSMQSVVVGWELYQRTGRSMTLAWVGLIQALPIFLFALHAGHVADTYSRKRIAVTAQMAVCLCSFLLAGLSATHAGIPLFYLCLLGAATARAFGNPARGALLPQVVPRDLLSNAISWDTSIRRIAVMSGAALGGWLLAWSRHASFVYGSTATIGLVSAMLLTQIADRPAQPSRGEPATWKTLIAGIDYIRHTKIILATITLDLFAVLLGGATTLLPVYARDILRVGPEGLGWLRAAPSAGALITALSIAHLPAFRYPGPHNALGRGRLRRGDDRVRLFPLDAALAGLALYSGRARHDQRGRAPDPRADAHARRHARARQRREQRLYQYLQRGRRLRVGPRGAVHHARLLRRQRRRRHARRRASRSPTLAPAPRLSTGKQSRAARNHKRRKRMIISDALNDAAERHGCIITDTQRIDCSAGMLRM